MICILQRLNLIDDYENNLDQHEDDSLEFREKRRDKFALSLPKKFILVVLSLCGLGSYYLFAVLCKSKENCDDFTPYITIIPVCLLIYLQHNLTKSFNYFLQFNQRSFLI